MSSYEGKNSNLTENFTESDVSELSASHEDGKCFLDMFLRAVYNILIISICLFCCVHAAM